MTTAPVRPAPVDPPRGMAVGRPMLLVPAVAVLAGAVLLSLLVGNQPLSPAELVAGLVAPTGGDTDLIVLHLRVPRTLAGVLAGIALGLAGALIQGLIRNPLGDPGVLGINAGAALAAVVALHVCGVASLVGYVWFAFAGAAVAAVVVYAIASTGPGGPTPVTLALAGAAVSALLGSVTAAITLSDTGTFERFRFWMVGSLARADLATVAQAVPFVVVGGALALGMGRALNTLALGADVARSLGARTAVVGALGMTSVVVLAGTATAVAGPIGFVGLVAPHVARMLAGPDHRWLLPWSAVLAPTVLLLADVAGRVVLRPEEVQVGVMAAAVGAPVFLYLVRRRRSVAL